MEDEQAQEATAAEEQVSDAQNESGEQADTQKTFDADYVKGLRAEAAKYRREAKAAQEKVKTFEDRDLSEQDKALKEANEAKQRAEQAEAALKHERLTGAITRAASKAGFADPDDAVALIDQSKVEYDDDGKPANIDTLTTDLLKRKPHLKGQTATGGALTNGSRSGNAREGSTETPEQRRTRLYGGGGGVFDSSNARSRGGGVHWVKEPQ